MSSIYDLTMADLTDLMKAWSQPAFRAKQVWRWLYTQHITEYGQMKNIPAALQERLAAETSLLTLKPIRELHSNDNVTVKWLFQLPDGQFIETVLMSYDGNRRTACISTQAGCAMGCVFCATGQMGFSRQLSVGEIIEQLIVVARWLDERGERLSNVVLMGMGEPLHNYDNVIVAIKRMNAPEGLGIGQRHITLSTVGLVPQIRRFADEGLQVKLAISLHAATDQERSDLLPVNKRWGLDELIYACRYYISQTGRRITFEWALIEGENDTPEQAHNVGKLLSGLLCHVNLIPLNPTTGYSGQPSNSKRVTAFQEILDSYGIGSTVRVRRGIDINAGCGQLKADVLTNDQG